MPYMAVSFSKHEAKKAGVYVSARACVHSLSIPCITSVPAVAVRGDQNNETEKNFKTKATEDGIKFLQKHLS